MTEDWQITKLKAVKKLEHKPTVYYRILEFSVINSDQIIKWFDGSYFISGHIDGSFKYINDTTVYRKFDTGQITPIKILREDGKIFKVGDINHKFGPIKHFKYLHQVLFAFFDNGCGSSIRSL